MQVGSIIHCTPRLSKLASCQWATQFRLPLALSEYHNFKIPLLFALHGLVKVDHYYKLTVNHNMDPCSSAQYSVVCELERLRIIHMDYNRIESRTLAHASSCCRHAFLEERAYVRFRDLLALLGEWTQVTHELVSHLVERPDAI